MSDPNKPESKTDQLYKPIADYGEAHRKAIANMTAALGRNDQAAMKQYFDEAIYCEQMQREAGIAARRYLVQKAQAKGT